jgi:DNA-directed RNA polymerase sigma subunit (sigma70/sigma32)
MKVMLRVLPDGWDKESVRESYLRCLLPRELWVIRKRFVEGESNFRVLGMMMGDLFGGGRSRESVRRVERKALMKMLRKQKLREKRWYV